MNYENNILFYDSALTAEVRSVPGPIAAGLTGSSEGLEPAQTPVEQHPGDAWAAVVTAKFP